MLLRALVSLGLVAALTMGCSAPTSEIAHTNDADLIGGDYLTDGDLPSTLQVGGCTAAKVGPRHILLAAHCVWDGGLREDYADGKPIRVTNAVSVSHAPTVSGSAAPTEFQVLTIKHTHVGQEWIEKCSSGESSCMEAGVDNANRASDVALFETVEEIANVPIATIDTTPLAPGEPVIVTGYGCEGSVGGYWSYETQKLKAGVVQLLPATATLHDNSEVDETTVSVIAAHDLITPGPAWPTPGPGLCPGDSGGPLYRAKGGGATVVGINASYTFSGWGAGLPVTNWHTRLDRVGAWLASLGASTCEGETCPTRAPVPALASIPPTPEQTAALASDGRDLSCQVAVNDLSKLRAAIDEILDTTSFCFPMNAARTVLPGTDSYVYHASAYCGIIRGATAPAAAKIAGFSDAMAAKGFPRFAFANNVIRGTVSTPACDTLPTGDEACRATVPTADRVVSDLIPSSGKKATCTTTDPEAPFGDYVTVFHCAFDGPLPDDGQGVVAAMEALNYRNVTYDAEKHIVTGVGNSVWCGLFSGRE